MPKKDCIIWNVVFINLIAVIYRIHTLLYTHVRENHMIICLMLCCLKRHLLRSLCYWGRCLMDLIPSGSTFNEVDNKLVVDEKR